MKKKPMKPKLKNSHRLLEVVSSKEMCANTAKPVGKMNGGAKLNGKGKWGIEQ